MSHLSTALHGVIEDGAVDTLYQPVYDIRGDTPRVHLLEALSRSPDPDGVGDPRVLIAYARRKGLEPAFDRVCTSKALRRIATVPNPPRIAVNVHASTLSRDAGFIAFISEVCASSALPVDRLVLEIVEHAPAWTRGNFSPALEAARLAGIRIALDDVGEGQSNLRMMFEIEPDYLKLDAFFVAGCAEDSRRRAVISSVAQLAGPFGARVVAEGIERQCDLRAVEELGITLVQGFVLARPMSLDAVRGLLAKSFS